MKGKRIIKIVFLVGAILMFIMVPIYYFIMPEGIGWKRWLPGLLLFGIGMMCIINCFIMQIEEATKKYGNR